MPRRPPNDPCAYKAQRPNKGSVNPKVVRALELLPKMTQAQAAQQAGIAASTLRRAIQHNPSAKKYMERIFKEVGGNAATYLAGLMQVNAKIIASAEMECAHPDSEDAFLITEETKFPLGVMMKSLEIGQGLVSLQADLDGGKKQAAINPADRQPREERIKAIVAELIAEGRAEDSAYRIAEYQLGLEERRLSSQLVQ